MPSEYHWIREPKNSILQSDANIKRLSCPSKIQMIFFIKKRTAYKHRQPEEKVLDEHRSSIHLELSVHQKLKIVLDNFKLASDTKLNRYYSMLGIARFFIRDKASSRTTFLGERGAQVWTPGSRTIELLSWHNDREVVHGLDLHRHSFVFFNIHI